MFNPKFENMGDVELQEYLQGLKDAGQDSAEAEDELDYRLNRS